MLQSRWQTRPRLISFTAINFADGVALALAWACGLAVIWCNIWNIGSLSRSP